MKTALTLLLLFLLPTACSFERLKNHNGDVESAENLETVGFDVVVQEVFGPGQCLSCHSPPSAAAGIRLDSYSVTLSQSDLVIAGQPEISRLYRSIATGFMPPSSPLQPERVELLRRWIAEGAVENSTQRLPTPEPPANPDPPPDELPLVLDTVYQVILTPHCISCHKPGGFAGFLDLTQPEAVMGLVVAGQPDSSFLYTVMASGAMPPSGTLDPEKIELVRQWISQGALQ